MSSDGAAGSGGPSEITIPSSGLEYWNYRRACFLAGTPCPGPSSPFDSLPETYSVPPPPPPLPPIPQTRPPRGSSLERLEVLLTEFGPQDKVAWNGGLGVVHHNLSGGKRLAKRLRLSLVIKILRAGWVRDGTWPLDPATGRPVTAPDSPVSEAVQAPPVETWNLDGPTSDASAGGRPPAAGQSTADGQRTPIPSGAGET